MCGVRTGGRSRGQPLPGSGHWIRLPRGGPPQELSFIDVRDLVEAIVLMADAIRLLEHREEKPVFGDIVETAVAGSTNR